MRKSLSRTLQGASSFAVLSLITAFSVDSAMAEARAARWLTSSAAEQQLQVGSSIATDNLNAATLVPLPGIVVKVQPGSKITLLSNEASENSRNVRVSVESGSASVYLDKQYAKSNDFAVVTCQGEIKASDALFNVAVDSPESSVAVVDGQVTISLLSGSVKTLPGGLVSKLSDCGVNATASEGAPISQDEVAVKAASNSLTMLAESVARKDVSAQTFAGVVLLVETTISPDAAQNARQSLGQLIATNRTSAPDVTANRIASADSNSTVGSAEQGSFDDTKTFADGKTFNDGKTFADGKTFNDGKTFADGKSDPEAPGEGPGSSITALRPPSPPPATNIPNVSL